mmetsp:Transcript_133416/g.266175  ORF Transcript_133416/g.266175 Transcript_133416/m.266175 type:complete len:239 (+) Transcript_133416:131-847(+)
MHGSLQSSSPIFISSRQNVHKQDVSSSSSWSCKSETKLTVNCPTWLGVRPPASAVAVPPVLEEAVTGVGGVRLPSLPELEDQPPAWSNLTSKYDEGQLPRTPRHPPTTFAWIPSLPSHASSPLSYSSSQSGCQSPGSSCKGSSCNDRCGMGQRPVSSGIDSCCNDGCGMGPVLLAAGASTPRVVVLQASALLLELPAVLLLLLLGPAAAAQPLGASTSCRRVSGWMHTGLSWTEAPGL